MCGIVTLLLGPEEQDNGVGPVLDALAALKPGGDAPEDFEEAGERAEKLSLSLMRPAAFSALILDPGSRTTLADAAAAIRRFLDVAEEHAARPGISLLEGEGWNAAAVRFRDASWRLEKDLLENIPRVSALSRVGAAVPGADAEGLLAHAFRLNLILNSLDRLEVRGRDSAGMGTVVWFRDAAALAAFREEAARVGLADALTDRLGIPDLVHGSVLLTGGDRPALVFIHKTAEEIGSLGQNVARIRDALAGDRLYWLAVGAAGARTEVLAHTRWASNGIVNEANCHPVDDRSGADDAGVRFLAVLNGDIDNFQALREKAAALGRPVPFTVTTDAKIIPMWVAEKYRETGDVGEAFRLALQEFEGAFAIALLSTAEPGVVHLALRGSGQALYVGRAPSGLMVASEIYGLVEACDRYVRLEGERPRVAGRRETAGQTTPLSGAAAFPEGLVFASFDGARWTEAPRVFQAGITTRDIHRGDFEHYFLKEITESPRSFAKTIRGKFAVDGEGEERRAVFAFGPETVPTAVLERLREGGVKRAYFIGQGTASVAANGIARLWGGILGRTGMIFSGVKASELSGFGLERDMRDCLVVAVSQSGTTTDTNRTVELVKGRGAAVLAIVNRRHSDLVHRADGVVYTGDGRDVEMSVASTKAFYAQVAAGYALGLYLASALKALPAEEIARRLDGLNRFPDLMEEVLRRTDRARELARTHAPRVRHWAVVGSGLDRVAAEEIRIKLSELTYKSISCDFLEDKKHIDLSAEPLVLVCAVSQAPANVPDAVKEVAIFRAHRATPIVIVPDGEDRFAPYAAGTLAVPAGAPELSFLLETMAGHLWGYYAAQSIDARAQVLKEARAAVVQALPAVRARSGGALAAALRLLRTRLGPLAREFSRTLRDGAFNSSLEVDTATGLQALFGYLLGLIPLRDFQADFGERGTWDGLLDRFLLQASRGIGELTRPIDAIKHQAKTVTVGISREELVLSGPILAALEEARFPLHSLDDAKRAVLDAAARAVADITGFTRYTVENLDETGMPTDATTIRIVAQGGVAENLPSRASAQRPLFGTKRRAVVRGRVWLGSGRSDGRSIILVPGDPRDGAAPLLLLHVRYREKLPLEEVLQVLKGYYERYDELRWAATELDPGFTDAKLEGLPVLDLLEADLNTLAARILVSGGKAPPAQGAP